MDNFGATAWNYAQARQLHYCMLIIASYIRQEAKTEQDPRAPVDVEDEMPSYSEHIGDSVSVLPAEVSQISLLSFLITLNILGFRLLVRFSQTCLNLKDLVER